MSKSRVAERNAAYALKTAVEPAFGTSFDLLATAPQGVAKLRQLTLSFAIRGKLVPQNAADGSASSLLKRVHEERVELATRGTLKRKTAKLVDHGEEWTELPESWAWTCLANIGVINPRNDVSDDTEASFVQMSSVPVALLEPHKSERRPWREIKSGFTHFAEGDVGVAKITPCFENGKSTVFRNLDSGIGAGTTELHVVRPLASISPDYVLSFLKSPEFLLPGKNGMTGSAGQKRLSRHYFETRAFPLPPLAEQARIVARVEELMQLCDALEAHGRLQDEQHARLVATLFDALAASASAEELAENWQRIATHFDLLLDRPEAVDALEQTLLQLAVRGLLVPQDPTEEPASELLARIRVEKGRLTDAGFSKRTNAMPDISAAEQMFEGPNGWRWARIGDYCDVQGGIQKTPLRRPVKNHFPYLRVANVQRNALDLGTLERYELSDEEVERWRLRAGDLLVVEGNGSETEIGRCAIWRGAVDPCVFQNHLIRVRPVFAAEAVEFLQLFLNSPDGVAEMKRLAITTSGLYNLSVGKIRNLAVPVPPLTEQHRIVARVEQLRRLCAELRERLQQTRATQSRLGDALVSAAA
jgi:type I restriction enzyme S subunit